MVNRSVTAECSNTPSNHVTQTGRSKCSGCKLNGRLPNSHFFVATILLRTVWSLNGCLHLSLELRKGGGWSLDQFQQYSINHPRLRYALAGLRSNPRAKGQVMLMHCLVMRGPCCTVGYMDKLTKQTMPLCSERESTPSSTEATSQPRSLSSGDEKLEKLCNNAKQA